jgi:hypothetical protein
MKIRLKLALLLLASILLPVEVVHAVPAFGTAATPARIDATVYGGFMVFGAFGNAASCSVNDQYFVRDTHPQFKQIYTMVLLAMATGQKITFFAHGCEPVLWYSVPTITYNAVTSGSVTISP